MNLNAYAGQTVQIAFVNNSNDMYVLWLDDVQLIVPAANDLILGEQLQQGLNSFASVSSNKNNYCSRKNNGYNNVTSFVAKYNNVCKHCISKRYWFKFIIRTNCKYYVYHPYNYICK